MEKIQQIMKLSQEEEQTLRKNYREECKTHSFQALVDTIDISEEVKMKYTSLLKEASIEFQNCLNCKGLKECPNKMKGFLFTPVAHEKMISFDYMACSYKRKEIKDSEYLNNIELFETSSAIKNASIKEMDTNDKERIQILKYFNTFLKQYGKESVKGLYLNGSFGTGKTYLIAALFNEMAKRNVRSAIVYYPEFLRSLKESFDTDYKEKFHYIRKVPLLLIDDIGAESVSPWSRDEILGSILQYRMEEGLPTFFTSNLTINELEEHLSLTNKGVEKVKARRIIERIQYMTNDIKLVSVNRRQNKK